MCIYVRDITNEEGVQLKRILRRSNDSFRVKRAQVILASAQKMKVPEIANSFGFSSDYVSYVVHGFNEIGFEVLESNIKTVVAVQNSTTDNVRRLLISL